MAMSMGYGDGPPALPVSISSESAHSNLSSLLAIDSRRTRQIESLRRRFQIGLSLT